MSTDGAEGTGAGGIGAGDITCSGWRGGVRLICLSARNLSARADIRARSKPGSDLGCAGASEASGLSEARWWLTGLVSKAMRLTSRRCRGEMLSEVTLPPHEPHPRVVEGSRSVVKPIAPWVEGLFTIIREAGILLPYWRAASRLSV